MIGSKKEYHETRLPNYYKCHTKIESSTLNNLCHFFRQWNRMKLINSSWAQTGWINVIHTIAYYRIFILACWKRGKIRRVRKFKNIVCYHQPTVDKLKGKDWNFSFPVTVSCHFKQDCASVFVSDYLNLCICSEHKEDFDQNTTCILHNKEVYREALHLQKQLKVVSKGVDRLEDDDTAAAVSMEIWLDLINSNELEPQNDNSNMI